MHQDITPTDLEAQLRARGSEEDSTPAPEPTPAEPAAPPTNAETPASDTPPPLEDPAFHRTWWDTVREELQSTPELKDERSELGQALQAVLRETPLYSLAPDGFRHAAALARARHTASAVPALHAKLEALARENERLVKLTSVTGSGPARHAGDSHTDLNERDLRRLAHDHDSL